MRTSECSWGIVLWEETALKRCRASDDHVAVDRKIADPSAWQKYYLAEGLIDMQVAIWRGCEYAVQKSLCTLTEQLLAMECLQMAYELVTLVLSNTSKIIFFS